MPRLQTPAPFLFGLARLAGVAACLALPACRPHTSETVSTAPVSEETTIEVTRGSIRRRADRAALAPPFWLAIGLVDPAAAERGAKTGEERLFAGAFRALVEGRDDDALVLFAGLTNASDESVRSASRTGQTLVMQAQGRWSEIAALESAADVIEPVDRASIFVWGRAFAQLPPAVIRVQALSARLPLRISTAGTPVIQVRINGSERNFWLDTGASLSIVASDVARQLGVATIGHDTLALATWGGRVNAVPGVVARLEIGSMQATGVPVAILDPTALQFQRTSGSGEIGSTVRLDGVIGMDMLRHLAVTLDVRSGEVTIGRPAKRDGDPSRRNLYWLGFPVTRLVASSGRSALFGIDTGADSTTVGESWFLVDSAAQLLSRPGKLLGLGETSVTTLQVVRQMLLSDGAYTVRLRNVTIAPERRSTFITMDGVLGSDFIRSSVVHIDFASGEFSIRPTHRPRMRDAIDVTSH